MRRTFELGMLIAILTISTSSSQDGSGGPGVGPVLPGDRTTPSCTVFVFGTSLEQITQVVVGGATSVEFALCPQQSPTLLTFKIPSTAASASTAKLVLKNGSHKMIDLPPIADRPLVIADMIDFKKIVELAFPTLVTKSATNKLTNRADTIICSDPHLLGRITRPLC